MGNPRESQGILRNAGKSWEIQAKLREPSGITETALPVSMYSQVYKSLLFFVLFSASFSGAFWEVFGGIWGVIFDHFSLLFSIKKLVDFSTDFSSIFGWILGVRISENEHLVQARRSFSQNRLFRFWHDFGSEMAPKRHPKWSQNGFKNQSKNRCNF